MTRTFRQNILKIIGVFLLFNLAMPHSGGMNAGSRFATSMAVAFDGKFQIDHYYKLLTADWSLTPDGHYYSNKAPLPGILGAPVVWIAAKFIVPDGATEFMRNDILARKSAKISAIISWLTQVIPMCILAYALAAAFMRWGVSENAAMIALFAILFGNTASVYFNNFFGHGLASLCALASVMFAIDRKVALSAFFFGAALLSDYGSALLLPGLFLIWWTSRSNLTRLTGQIILGAAAPAVLWLAFHWTCFGGPFTLPSKFQNPMWVDLKEQTALWGIFHAYPQPDILYELLIGPSRGLLLTQPWILVLLGIGMYRLAFKNETLIPVIFRGLTFLFVSSMILLLIMNASFGGWHGGLTNGPRYLTPAMLVGGLLLAPIFDSVKSTAWLRTLLLGTLGFGMLYYVVGFAQDLQTEMYPWLEYIHGATRTPRLARMALGAAALIALSRSIFPKTNVHGSHDSI